MKLTKLLSISVLLLFLTLEMSAQTPKIIWKNLQDNYASFFDIKPIIVNLSNQPIYYDCEYNYPDETEDVRLLSFDNQSAYWFENVAICGNQAKEQMKADRKMLKSLKRLIKEGKYIPDGCRINPNEEVNFANQSQMKILSGGDGIIEPYTSGRFKFKLRYHWANSIDEGMSESPEFLVKSEKPL